MHSDIAAFNDILYMYMRRAKKKGLTFELSEKQFRELTSSDCHYCNRKPSQNSNRKQSASPHNMRFKVDYIYNGIDRMNSDIGYISSNCVPCCGDCNAIKSDILSYEEMQVAMKAVLTLRGK